MAFEIPMKLPSVANLREHWAAKARRAKEHRRLGFTFGNLYLRGIALPCVVRIVRVAPRALDSDNLSSACKNLRDGLADAIGVDDRDPRVMWEYGQEKGKVAKVRVEVRIL